MLNLIAKRALAAAHKTLTETAKFTHKKFDLSSNAWSPNAATTDYKSKRQQPAAHFLNRKGNFHYGCDANTNRQKKRPINFLLPLVAFSFSFGALTLKKEKKEEEEKGEETDRRREEGREDDNDLDEFFSSETTQTIESLLAELPVEEAKLSAPPDVPPPIQRRHPVRLVAKLESQAITLQLTRDRKYKAWAFNRTVPGPFIRARQGDLLEIQFTNRDEDGIAHNIDFHAVIGPGGGSSLLLAEKDQTRVARFRLIYPGLYIYHCATGPIPMHISNGMYGLILVEPKKPLPAVDKEFYVMQSEFYSEASLDTDQPADMMEYSYSNGLNEQPQSVVFNGRDGALTDRPLLARTGQRVRIFFGNAGPNLTAAFHCIGQIFDRCYRDGGLMDAPARGLQTVLVPPGGATIVEMEAVVPGTYTLVDHAIHRIDKGAIGYLKVAGPAREDLYSGESMPTPCPNCKMHE